ncbi:response regulator [Seleniivibrio sp.]|uniref:response regulator n=1 Tax=Seleniivibrio sp. TaxID=2898801 RepID=UPI0025F821EC|nr:response regulator [Seleniivibrio sp.]MCD8553227.1 response regulator [Seleniivibrio sp.]
MNEEYIKDVELLKNLSIMHVEDDTSVRESLMRFLKRRFETIFTAKDGQEGLEMYKANRPDIVITDIQMPVMDGIEMAKKILEINPDAVIVITTAFNEKPYIDKASEIGIFEYLKKPVVKEDLTLTLRKCAERLKK